LPLFLLDPAVAPYWIDAATDLRLERVVPAWKGLESCLQEWASPENVVHSSALLRDRWDR
jgi:hypothetical protein